MPRLNLKSLVVETGPGLFARYPLDKARRYRLFKGKKPLLPERDRVDCPEFVFDSQQFDSTVCLGDTGENVFNFYLDIFGTVNYIVSSSASWLVPTPLTGNVSNEIDNIYVSYDSTPLSAGVTYTGIILVSGVYGNCILTDYLTGYLTTNTQASLSVAALSYNVTSCCGDSLSSQLFYIANTEYGTLNWLASSNVDWITVTPSTGTTSTEIDTITAVFTPQLSGTVTGLIMVSGYQYACSYTNTQYITTNITTLNPELSVNSLSYIITTVECANASNEQLFVSNINSCTMSYIISDNVNWLTVTPTTSSSNSSIRNSHTVIFDTSGLQSGTYNGTITVSAGYCTINPYKTVGVTLSVLSPMLSVASLTYDITSCCGDSLSSQLFYIDNTGYGTLNWITSSNVNWITVTPVSGTTSTEIDTITAVFTPQLSSTSIGLIMVSSYLCSYTETKYITANITTLNPELSVNLLATTVYVMSGNDAIGETFALTNISNNCTLSYIASTNVSWLTVTPISGTLVSGVISSHDLTFTTAALASGLYTGNVVISSGYCTINPLHTMTVTLSVIPYGNIFVIHGQDTGNPTQDMFIAKYNMFNGVYNNYHATLPGTVFKDIESMSYISGSRIVFTEEMDMSAPGADTLGYWTTANILDIVGVDNEFYTRAGVDVIRPLYLNGYNRGVEGTAWDKNRGILYFANEGNGTAGDGNSPTLISAISCDINGNFGQIFNAFNVFYTGSGYNDFSDIYHDSIDDTLYFLTDNMGGLSASVIVKTTIHGTPLQSNLTAPGTAYFPGDDNPEGITFSADRKYMMLLGEIYNYAIFRGTPGDLTSYQLSFSGTLTNWPSANANTSSITYIPVDDHEYDL